MPLTTILLLHVSATGVGSKAIPMWGAVLLASVFEFIGEKQQAAGKKERKCECMPAALYDGLLAFLDRDTYREAPCLGAPAASPLSPSFSGTCHSRMASYILLSKPALPTVAFVPGAISLGGSVSGTIRGDIARPEYFKNDPHIFAFGEVTN